MKLSYNIDGGITTVKDRFSISVDKTIHALMKKQADEEFKRLSNVYQEAAYEFLIRKGKIAVENNKS